VVQVAGALEDSETLQLSEDKQFVKRKAPLVSRDVVIKEMDERLVSAISRLRRMLHRNVAGPSPILVMMFQL
jgi:hypothetical protein